MRPKSKLNEECISLLSSSEWLLELFKDGIPENWYDMQPGYVGSYALLSSASMVFR
jgi:hypothetical protein